MKTTLHYSESMTLCIQTLGMTVTMDLGPKVLDDVLTYVEDIFADNTMFHAECVDDVHIINTNTGELIAECKPDSPIKDDNDWDYNEDEGFDPYEGGYTYDC